MNRETRIGLALVAGLGALIFSIMVLGSLGAVNPELEQIPVAKVLGEGFPAVRYGRSEVRIVGWYAELAGDCSGDSGGVDAAVAWLQRECPLRVLLPSQPPETVTQAQLGAGLRLAAPTGGPFPSRAGPGGPNLRLEQLVFVGHFDDPAAVNCIPDRVDRCRNTFVVSDYSGLIR
ncbi:MAG: hypothetical protein E6J47_03125 [Chloroflexi bacterium]|nr:MAG: hypothetical protein E6J47_03125 [Chloroflexota bacterium]